MSFTSISFLFAFLPVALLGYYLIRGELRDCFLLLLSLLFYAEGLRENLGTFWPVLLLVASIAANYISGLLIYAFKDRVKLKNVVLIISLCLNIGLLFIFKYLSPMVKSANLLGFNMTVPEIILPLGISFFTFRAISYVLDIYFDFCPAEKNPISVGVYLSFFPQLSMGPIIQYEAFRCNSLERKFSVSGFAEGVKRFIIGMAKKALLADGIAAIVNYAFSNTGSGLTILFAWIGAIGYLVQLYFDFSGYSDMAIGLSRMFGFDCTENFNYPYISKTIAEFWRRWHITLGNWLKNYLYTPVSRSLIGKKNFLNGKKIAVEQCDVLALFVVWFCCGAWHGAGLKFIVYGLYYYTFIVTERILERKRKKRAKKLGIKLKNPTWRIILSHIYALLVIIVGQIIFRAESLGHSLRYIGCMIGIYGNHFFDTLTLYWLGQYWLFIIAGILFSIPVVPALRRRMVRYKWSDCLADYITPVIYFALMIVSLAFIFAGTNQSFIYFQF